MLSKLWPALLLLCACEPRSNLLDLGAPTGDQSTIVDLSPDLAPSPSCGSLAGNLAKNPSFDEPPPGNGIVYNTEIDLGGGGDIPQWHGCCRKNDTDPATSIWTLSQPSQPPCNHRLVSLQGKGAVANVLYQQLSLSDAVAAGRKFELSAWIQVLQADPAVGDGGIGAALSLDLFDLSANPSTGPKTIVAESDALAAGPLGAWRRVVVSGTMPSYSPSLNVQIRFRNSGTLRAVFNNAALVIK